MDFDIHSGELANQKVDAIIILHFQDQPPKEGEEFEKLNAATSGLLREHIREEEFESKLLQTLVLHSPRGLEAKHLVIVGAGQESDYTHSVARQVAAKGAQTAAELGVKTIAIQVYPAPAQETARMLVEGVLLGTYQFNKYKTIDKEKLAKRQLLKITLVSSAPAKIEELRRGAAYGESVATAIMNARDLVNEPPSKIKPSSLAMAAKEVAQLSANISAVVLDKDKLQKEGYRALLAVAAGSSEEPYLIHLCYKPKNARRRVAFVGKGVTFDSGGLGIKPWGAMLSMKADMAGAATVLGIFQALAELEALGQPIDQEVHGVIVASENMISGCAMKPDDIIETKNGKTIEILHTDAEGRLILADALTFTLLQNPQYIIDFATLTGAAIGALGPNYSAYMGNDQPLIKLVGEACQQTGELGWELPLPEIYQKYLKSDVADLQNINKNNFVPGAIYGGLFLQEFVNETPWVHIDIAGPGYENEGDNPVYPKGGTGYGILLGLKLLELL